MLAVVFLIAMFRYYKSMRDKQEELFKASLKAQEEERGRIAEDLHDDIGPRLSALKLSIDLMRNDFEKSERIQMIDETTEMLDFVIKDIRVIVRNLAAKYISEKGIYLQLIEFKKQIEKGGVFKIDMEIDCFKEYLDPDFAINLYRIIQELINNSVKHAKSNRIDIIAERTVSNLSIIYKDNGVGFEESKITKGLGLSNILTRIKLYKGQCVVNSKPDKGTCYTINFDLKNINTTKVSPNKN
jgi:signal transduction histidine kinase